MADKPDITAAPPVIDSPHAPIIFFDNVPTFNNYNNVVGLTLSVIRTLPDNKGGVTNDQVIVAFLRGNIQAALSLRKAIDDALLLGAKTEGEAAH
jgi:hypothetical protein